MDEKLEAELRNYIAITLTDVLQHFEEESNGVISKYEDVFETEEEVNRRFQPKTYGSHEAMDRAFMIYENWEEYVLGHPTTAMNKKAFLFACMAKVFMMETYQEIARNDIEES